MGGSKELRFELAPKRGFKGKLDSKNGAQSVRDGEVEKEGEMAKDVLVLCNFMRDKTEKEMLRKGSGKLASNVFLKNADAYQKTVLAARAL